MSRKTFRKVVGSHKATSLLLILVVLSFLFIGFYSLLLGSAILLAILLIDDALDPTSDEV